jgi:tetratricopeptide (TPR) repeat protein
MQARLIPGALCLGALSAALLAGCSSKQEQLASHLQKGRDYLAQGNYDKARVELKNVLQIDPKQAQAYYVLGEIEEQQHNLQRAFGAYQKAQELDPTDMATVGKLGNIYLFAGDTAHAKQNAEQVLARNPDDPSGLTLRAAVLARDKDAAGAEQTVRRVIQLDPHHVDAYGLLAGLYLNQKRNAEAAQVLEQGIGTNPDKADLRLLLVNVYAAQNLTDKAVAQYRELIAREPGNRDYRTGLARLYAAAKDQANAEKTLRESIQADSDDAQRRITLADFLVGSGRRDQAVKELTDGIAALPEAHALGFALAALQHASGKDDAARAALQVIIDRDKLGPDGLRARTEMASLQLAAEHTAEAQKLLAEVLKENPRDNAALLLRSQMEVASGDLVGAIADLRSVQKDQPASIEVMTRLARAHLANNEPQLAVETMGKAVELAPKDTGARILLAQVKAAAGDRKAALAELDTVLKADPGAYAALLEKARLEMADRNPAQAEKTLAGMRQAFPRDPSVAYQLGVVQFAQHKLEPAAASFEQALAMQPGAIEPLAGLADVYFGQGQPERAIQRVARAADTGNVFAMTLLGRLLERQNRADEAEAAFRKAVSAAPASAGAHMELAAFYLRHKDQPKAEAALNAGLAALPGDTGLKLELAETYRRFGAVDKAMAQYEGILKDHPGNDVASNNLASMLLDSQADASSAERALVLARRFKDSPNPAYLDTFGWAEVRAAHVEEGLPALRKAVDRAPDVPVFQYHLGAALQLKGDVEAARPLLRKAAEAGADFPGKDQAKALLAKG